MNSICSVILPPCLFKLSLNFTIDDVQTLVTQMENPHLPKDVCTAAAFSTVSGRPWNGQLFGG